VPNKLGSFIRLLINNWWLKLLALCLAVVTFYAIRGATGYEVDYSIPVEVVVEPGIAVLNQDPSTVRVRFRGARADLLRLDERHIKAVVAPKAGEPDGSEKAVILSPRDIEGAAGATIVKIEPSVISLTFDREVETTVSVVKPRTIGSPLIGTVSVEHDPQTVKILGPKRRLAEMKQEGKDKVHTEPVDVDGRVESFTKQVRILPISDAWVSRIEPSEVTVTVSIVTEMETRTWDRIPVRAVTKPGDTRDIQIEPSTVDLSLEGRVEVLDGIGDDAIAVLVDCSELETAATYELPVMVHLPCQAEVTPTVSPDVVKVIVREE